MLMILLWQAGTSSTKSDFIFPDMLHVITFTKAIEIILNISIMFLN